jgi:hypothetical protein
MKSGSFWSERLNMLMACGSPGSALAYHGYAASLTPHALHCKNAASGEIAGRREIEGPVDSPDAALPTPGIADRADQVLLPAPRRESIGTREEAELRRLVETGIVMILP